MKKITSIITGLNGAVAPVLANYLTENGHQNVRWDRSKTSTDNYHKMVEFIIGQNVTHFFHIATGPPLWAETVARICFEHNIKFLFTGSVSVFDEKSKGPFSITHKPDATDDYGLYKIECENRIRAVNPNAIIARLGWQIGEKPGSNNMIDFLYKTMKERGLIEASSNWIPSCSFLKDSAKTLTDLALNYPSGTYHLEGNPTGLSFFQIVTALNEMHGLPWKVVETQNPQRNNLMIDKRVKVKSVDQSFTL